MEKLISQLNADGYFVGTATADESPLEPGVFLIPGGAVDMAPPDLQPGKVYKPRSDGSGWVAVEDFRAVALYLTSDGSAYTPGQERGSGDMYAGLGPIPDWLTADPRPDAWSVWKSGKWVRDDAVWRAHVMASNQAKQAQLLSAVAVRISTLQDAVELEIATEAEISALKELRVYRVELSRVDVTLDAPKWPIAHETAD